MGEDLFAACCGASSSLPPPLTLRASPLGGLGVFATRALSRGDEILRAGGAHTLTRARALAELAALPPAALAVSDDDACAIALLLLLQLSRGALPPSYLRALPSVASLGGLPALWPATCVSALRDDSFAAGVIRLRAERAEVLRALRAASRAGAGALSAAARALSSELARALGGSGEDDNDDAWVWACAIVSSRVHVRAGEDAFSLSLALVPGADFFNHATGRAGATLGADWVGDELVFRARVSVAEGEECFLSYGELTARSALETYGFVPWAARDVLVIDATTVARTACSVEEEGGDGVAASLECKGLALVHTATAPVAGLGVRALRRSILDSVCGLSPDALDLELPFSCNPGAAPSAPNTLPLDTVAVLRALVIDESDVSAHGLTSPLSGQHFVHAVPLSSRNERAAHALLLSLCARDVLSAYGNYGGDDSSGGGGEGIGAASLGSAVDVVLCADGIPSLTGRATMALEELLGRLSVSDAFAGARDAACSLAAATSALLELERAVACGAREADVWTGADESHTHGEEEAGGKSFHLGKDRSAAPWIAPVGDAASGVAAIRADCARAYRIARAKGLTAWTARLRELLRVDGSRSGGENSTPCASLPVVGLEVQSPFAEMLLRGVKTIETRDYALPASLLGLPIALLRAPPGGLARAGLSASRVIGVVTFSSSERYASREAWAADDHAHGVSRDAAPDAYGWPTDGKRYAWKVGTVLRVFAPPNGGESEVSSGGGLRVSLTADCRVRRSIFLLPHASHAARAALRSLVAACDAGGGDSDACTAELSFSPSSPRIRLAHLRRSADTLSSAGDCTGLYPWPLTRAVGALLSQPSAARALVADRLVVELGAGAAALSSLALALGAARVVSTDASSASLRLAARNVGSSRSVCSITRLLWGNSRDTARVVRALGGAADLVIASECVYSHRSDSGVAPRANALFKTIAALLGDSGVALVAYTPRLASVSSAVGAGARAAGLSAVLLDERLLLRALGGGEDWGELTSDIRVIVAARSAERARAAVVDAAWGDGMRDWMDAEDGGVFAWDGYAQTGVDTGIVDQVGSCDLFS